MEDPLKSFFPLRDEFKFKRFCLRNNILVEVWKSSMDRDEAAVHIQRVYRGHLGRKLFKKLKQEEEERKKTEEEERKKKEEEERQKEMEEEKAKDSKSDIDYSGAPMRSLSISASHMAMELCDDSRK
jgi:hypothetical protein